jgi:hypothetical protein
VLYIKLRGNAGVVGRPLPSWCFTGLRGAKQFYVLGFDLAEGQDQIDPLGKLGIKVIHELCLTTR